MAKNTFTSNWITVEFDDNSEEILNALKNAVDRGLKMIGETAVGYAQKNVPVTTGILKGSIAYQVDGDDCYIGSNVVYAPYVEYGTGVYSDMGGRQTPWTYKDEKGDWHRTDGMKPRPYLRPAASEHAKEYTYILKDSLQNA